MQPPVPSGTVYVKDPVDAWNKEQTIGLAELAVRNHAAAMPFDRRGDVIYWDDFESPSLKCYQDVKAASGGTTNRSTTNVNFGDFCMKHTTGATADDWTRMLHNINDFHVGKIGSQISFATESIVGKIVATIYYYTGTTTYSARLRYLLASGELSYFGDDGAYHAIETITFDKGAGRDIPYNTIKIVADIENGTYLRSLFFGSENDLSSYSLKSSASGIEKSMSIQWYWETTANSAETAYFDNFILTENEPS